MDVWVCILEADGGELAAALTAGAAAIADAGIPMTDLVSAVSLVSFWQTQAFWSQYSGMPAAPLPPGLQNRSHARNVFHQNVSHQNVSHQ